MVERGLNFTRCRPPSTWRCPIALSSQGPLRAILAEPCAKPADHAKNGT